MSSSWGLMLSLKLAAEESLWFFYRHLDSITTTLLRTYSSSHGLSDKDNVDALVGPSNKLRCSSSAGVPIPPTLPAKRSDALRIRDVQVGNICSVQATLLDHYIFFMSGIYKSIEQGGNVSEWTSEHVLFSLDLNTAFPVEVLLSPEFLHNTSIPSDITSDMISQAESVAYGGLLTSNNSLYVYGGGGTPDQNSQNVLASYDLTTSTWQSISILGDSCINEPRYFGQSASDLVSGLAFFLGGTGGFPGMLRFNTSNPSQVPCANQTLGSGSNGLSVPDTHGGAMVYLPVGEAGALLLLGGSNNSAVSPQWELSSMENIAVYDIYSSTWYSVLATGTPSTLNGRSRFCLGVSRAPDDSSFQVTLYGGTLEDRKFYDDVWVLSIPSFRWISVQDANNTELINNGPDAGRKGHTCTMWEDSQMIILGGMFSSPAASRPSTPSDKSVCDTTFSPIRLLDTSSYTWQQEYRPDRTYSIPSVISAVIGGDSSGNSNLTTPLGGWSDPNLAAIFSRTLPRVQGNHPSPNTSSSTAESSTTQRVNLSSPPSSEPSAAKPSTIQISGTSSSALSAGPSQSSPPTKTPFPKASTGLIAGVVGVVAAVALLCIVVIIIKVRRRKRREVLPPIFLGDDVSTGFQKPELEDNAIRELSAQTDPHELQANRAIETTELHASYYGHEIYTDPLQRNTDTSCFIPMGHVIRHSRSYTQD